MKQKKLFSAIFILVISISFLVGFNTLNAQITSVCKLDFCNCCQDSLFYHMRTMEGDSLNWTFWTWSDGCTEQSQGIGVASLIAGRTYYVEPANGCSPRVYFTACACPDGYQVIDIACDCSDKQNSQHNQNYNTLPKNFVLFQNFPNPFNPVTTIKFGLPSESFVKLTIYDAAGREIETLVSGITKAGFHEVTWDATNVASGIYFYKLKVGDFSVEKKMVVVK